MSGKECVWTEKTECVSACGTCGRIRVHEYVEGDRYTRFYQPRAYGSPPHTIDMVYSQSPCGKQEYIPNDTEDWS